MQIQGNAIRSLKKYLKQIGDGKSFKVGQPILGHEQRLQEIGFPAQLSDGMSVLPSGVGKTTEFNSQGKVVIRKDLPKERRSRMIHSSWTDWHGNTHSGIQYRDYEAYPREHVSGPEEEITLVLKDGALIAISRDLSYSSGKEDEILHLVNMFLEIFGECHLLDSNAHPLIKLNRLNWQILPPGEYPWSKAKVYIQTATSRLKESERPVIEHRIERITRHKPDFVAIGNGGFNGYFVFGFTTKNLFILESTHIDNATYVLQSNWQQLSSLTKKQILSANLHSDRLVHNNRWGRSLDILLR